MEQPSQETLDHIAELQRQNFEAAMHRTNTIGRLTNWRENMKNKSNQDKVYSGYLNILALVNKATLPQFQG